MSDTAVDRQAEYLSQYRSMQAQQAAAGTAAAATAASAHAAPARPHPDDDSDNDSDVDGTNSRFVFPGLRYPESVARRFRLSAWVPRLRRHTIPTRFVPLTQEFVDYLQEEGIWIPDQHAPVQAAQFHGRDSIGMEAQQDEEWKAQVETIETSDEEEEEEEDDGEDDADRARRLRAAQRIGQPFFPQLVSSLESALDELGRAVMPCLDFKAPTDATWIMTERVPKCQSIGDILLLLKSSDKVQRELETPFEHCSELDVTREEADSPEAALASPADASSAAAASSASPSSFVPTLALRKWSTLHPSKLFRCFVYRSALLCLCQHDPNYYDFLQSQQVREDIQDNVEGFLEDHLVPVLRGELGLESYVADVYIDLDDRCWLVKLKPFWPRATKALLFSWKEIHQLAVQADEAEARRRQASAANPPSQEQVQQALAEARAADSDAEAAAAADAYSSLNVPFRVVPSAAAGMDILRTMDSMSTRFPVEGFDVSDSAAIERWIKRVEEGDLKQN